MTTNSGLEITQIGFLIVLWFKSLKWVLLAKIEVYTGLLLLESSLYWIICLLDFLPVCGGEPHFLSHGPFLHL